MDNPRWLPRWQPRWLLKSIIGHNFCCSENSCNNRGHVFLLSLHQLLFYGIYMYLNKISGKIQVLIMSATKKHQKSPKFKLTIKTIKIDTKTKLESSFLIVFVIHLIIAGAILVRITASGSGGTSCTLIIIEGAILARSAMEDGEDYSRWQRWRQLAWEFTHYTTLHGIIYVFMDTPYVLRK